MRNATIWLDRPVNGLSNRLNAPFQLDIRPLPQNLLLKVASCFHKAILRRKGRRYISKFCPGLSNFVARIEFPINHRSRILSLNT